MRNFAVSLLYCFARLIALEILGEGTPNPHDKGLFMLLRTARWGFLLHAVITLASCASAVDILTFHNDTLRTGSNTTETILTPANINFAQFGKLYTRPVDGFIYAQPLYVSGVTIGGGTRNIVFVATMHNSVYAFDADNPNQAAYWQKSMGAAVPFAEVYTNGDQNMYPEIGIVSTPTIDKGTNTLYLVAMTKDGTNTYAHRVHALDLATGNEKFGGPVVVTAPPVSGSSAVFNSFRQGQRPALLQANGSIYVSFASFGDLPPYWGWTMRYNAATLVQQNVFNANPANVTAAGSGIWQSGCGAAADALGNIYLITGNGSQGAGRLGVLTGNYSETALKFGPTGLAVADYFTPSDVDSIDATDSDFGGGGHVLLPDQPGTKPHVMVCAGKNGQLYVIDRDNMTHYLADNDARILQKIAIGSNKSTPVYWNGPNGAHVYVQNENSGGILSFRVAVDSVKGYVQLTQDGQTPYGFQMHQLTVSSNGNKAGSGIIWAIGGTGGDVVHQTVPYAGTLHAFNAENMQLVYNSGIAGNGRDTLGGFAKYNTPTVANGRVYVPSSGNPSSASQLVVYGPFVDVTPPTIASVNAVNSNTKVTVVFSEFMDPVSATNAANYKLDRNVTISSAALAADQVTVTLTTSTLSAGLTYTLTVNNVKDKAPIPNAIAANSQKTFAFQVAPPTVSITAPVAGATFVAPAVLSINATAAAATGASIAKVDFFLNGTASGTATSAPYAITATNVAAGTYALTAKATDNNGFTTTSAAVNITVNAGNATYGLTLRNPVGPYLNNKLPPLATGTLPATLSVTGAFSSVSTMAPASGLIRYGVNSPLWSDSAQKSRWMSIPYSGGAATPSQQIGFAPTGEWTFPNGSVFVKHFDLAVDDTNPNVKKRIETRLLVRSSDGNVYGVTYKWRADNSDADLEPTAGEDQTITIKTATGTRQQVWHYPSRLECLTCHSIPSGGVLGLKTRQLNGLYTYPNGVTDNQLRALNHVGMFNPVLQETAIAGYTKVVHVTDTSAAIDVRARSYIDANCSFCHRPGGTNAAFDTRYDTPLASQNIIYGPVLNNLGITGAKVVVPKDRSRSLLYQRPNVLSVTKMPPLGHNLIDTSAVATIGLWIDSLSAGNTLVPKQGVTIGGNTVTITGTGFGSTTTVKFGANLATNVLVSSATTLTCTVPPSTNAALGAVDVVVSDGAATPNIVTTPGGYSYIARPPEFADATGKTQGVCAKFYYNGLPTISTTGPGTFDALPPYQGKIVKTNAMVGPAASPAPGTILSLTAANSTNYYAKISGYLKIVTPGAYTLYTASDDASIFYFGNTPATTSLIVNNNFAQGVVERSGQIYLAAGLHQFTILYGQGTGSYGFSAHILGPDTSNALAVIPDSALFVDAPPVITVASPNTGGVGLNTPVTLSGSGFAPGASVYIDAAPATGVTVTSPMSLTFQSPGGAPGTSNIVVVNPNGSADSTPFTFDGNIARPADNPANAVPGSFFRFYTSGVSGLAPGGPVLPNFPGYIPFRSGVASSAAYLTQTTVAYPLTGTDGFSLQHTGFLQIPSDGTYNFYTASDDASRMYIGGTLVVDNNFAQGVTCRTTRPIKLKAGLHKYTVQFGQGGNDFVNYLGWGSADAVPAIALDTATPHAGPPTTQIPLSAYYYVPPTWTGTGVSNWSTAANWNTDAGLGAFSPISTDGVYDSHVSQVLRFPAVGAAPYTANNDAPNSTPINVLELSSGINGNVISGTQLQFAGTAGYQYNGIAQPSILQLGSGSVTISAPVYVRDTMNLAGDGTGIVTLSGALTNYTGGGVEYKNLVKNNMSTYSITGSGAGFSVGSIYITGGTLGVNSPVNAAGVTVYPAGTLRGTGTLPGLVSVRGLLFPGDVSSVLNTAPKGTLSVGGADFSANAGTLAARVWLTDATHVEADNLTITSAALNAFKADATSTLNLRVQIPTGVVVVSNLDVEIVHGGDMVNNTYSSGFGNLQVAFSGGSTNLTVLYVNKNFTPNSGDTANIVASQLPNQAPNPPIAPNSYNRIFVRFNNSVMLARVVNFNAKMAGAGIFLDWTLTSEHENAGFNVWRRDTGVPSNQWKKINPALIPGRITHSDPKTYRLYDWDGNEASEYRLECVDMKGMGEYFSTTHPVDWASAPSALHDDELAAALASVQTEKSVTRAADLTRAFVDAERALSQTADNPKDEPNLQRSLSKQQALAARIVRVDSNTDVSLLEKLGISGASNRNASDDTATGLNDAPRMLSSVRSAASTTTGETAKVVYQNAGVLRVPQSSLPPGFVVGKLTATREGRTLTALAITNDALFLYAPGYSDEYTDKDAIFLTRSNKATPVVKTSTAAGLFDNPTVPVSTTRASVTSEYHDVYFDWALRPFSYPPWFSNQYLTEGVANRFSVAAPGAVGSAATMVINVWSLSNGGAASPDHNIQAFVNSVPVGGASWSGGGMALALSFNIADGILKDGDNVIEFVTPSIANVTTQVVLVHAITLQYDRTLRAATLLEITPTSASSQLYEVSGLPASRVWIVDNRTPDQPLLIPYQTQLQNDGTYKARFNAASGGTVKYLIVPAGSEIAPVSVTRRILKPVPTKTAYLAVGPAKFATALEPLIAARIKDGLQSAFVDQEDIFDYYGYGRYGPIPIQKVVRALHPGYLLLAGRTTADYHNYSGNHVDPLCPTFLVSTSFWSQAASDALFGDWGKGYPETAVGRFPVGTVDELAVLVQRTLDYKGAGESVWRGHLVSDEHDADSGDFPVLADAFAQTVNSIEWSKNYLKTPANNDQAAVNATLTRTANGGADLIVYLGHGNSMQLGKSAPYILDTNSVQSWSGNVVFLQSTCTANGFAKNQLNDQNIAIRALTQRQGGIAASIATTTYCTAAPALDFMQNLLLQANSPKLRWGDALMKAQQYAVQQSLLAAPTSRPWYSDLGKTECLLGDPALNIRAQSGTGVRSKSTDKF